MATSFEEIEKKKNQVEIPPTRRDYFTIPEFWKIRSLLPDYELEILSRSNRENIERDTVTKPEIYAALEIPAYWVIDRRNQSVWAHTKPVDGQYTLRAQIKGEQVLPAPGLEFLRITPAQIFL